MKFQITEKQKQVLIDIQKSIPKEWLDKAHKKEPIAPVTKEIMERALNDPDVDEETKTEFKLVLDSGYFDKEVEVEQEVVTNLINAFIEKEMIKAVIAKKLPKPKQKVSFEEVYKKYNEAKEIYDREYN